MKLSVPGYERKIAVGVMTYFQFELVGSDEKLEIATPRSETLWGDSRVAVSPEDNRYPHLVGKNVRYPLTTVKLLRIVVDDRVDRGFGPEVVKITPAQDQYDSDIGRRHNLKFINIFNDKGTLNSNTGLFKGQKPYETRYTTVAGLN